MSETTGLFPFPPRKKTQGEWLMETLAYYAEKGIALPPAQVRIWQHEIAKRKMQK